MKKVKKFISYNWDSLLIWFVTGILFFVIFVPFILNNSLDKFDTPGLLSISWFMKEFTFPDFQGWNPFFYGGYPQGMLYPPLFHYVVATLSHVISIQAAYKLVVTIAGLAIPITVLAFSRRLYKNKKWEVLSTLGVIAMLILLPGYLGFNLDGLIDYGLAPSFVSIPLFFLYLSQLFNEKHSFKMLAFLFSILLLTHLLTAAIAGAITFVLTVLDFKKKGGEFIFLGIVTFLLTAFWVVPFLAFKQFSASGFAMQISILFPAATAGIAGCILFCIFISKKTVTTHRLFSIIIVSLGIAGLGLADSIFNRASTSFSIPLIHPFRLQMYGLILAVAAGPLLVKKLLTFLKTKVPLIQRIPNRMGMLVEYGAVSTAVIIVFGLSLVRINPTGVEQVVIAPDTDWNGRVMRVYKVSEVLDQSRAVIDKSVMHRWNKFATMGLLKESSYLAPYYQSLAKNIDPTNYDWDSLDNAYIENKQIPEDKATYLMNLLWVKSLFTIDNEFPECTDFDKISQFESNSQKDGLVDRTMYICDYIPTQNSNFVEVVSEQPNVVTENWDEAVEEWWLGDETQLFTNELIEIPQSSLDFTPIPQVNFNTDYRNLYIKTGVEEEVYVLVKMNYFPKWKAVDVYGNDVPIYRTSPNLMIVPVKESVTLKYEMTSTEWTALLISITTWMSFFTISFYLKIKFRNLKK